MYLGRRRRRRCDVGHYTVAGVALLPTTENKVFRIADSNGSQTIVRLRQLREPINTGGVTNAADTYGCRSAQNQKVKFVETDSGLVQCYRQATFTQQ
jgi:hypothetical protein